MDTDQAQKFPLLNRFGVFHSLKTCEAFLRLCRLREELSLLPKEACQYMASMKHMITRLESRHKALSEFEKADLLYTGNGIQER